MGAGVLPAPPRAGAEARGHPQCKSSLLNCRLRDELLNQEIFFTLLEAQVLAEDRRTDHNKNHLGMMI